MELAEKKKKKKKNFYVYLPTPTTNNGSYRKNRIWSVTNYPCAQKL